MIKFFSRFICIAILATIFSSSAKGATLTSLSGPEFVNITKASDKNKLIFIFTSWCTHCKKSMPEIINMLQDPEIKTELFILSLDNKQGVIEKFVQMHMQSLDVKIYHISRGEEVVDMFKELKIGYRNSIPHITILNCNNERIFDGFTDTKQIENILRQN